VLACRFKTCAAVVLCVCAARRFATEPEARAQTPSRPSEVSFEAETVHLDGPSQRLDVSGHVRVDEPPFHLTSPELKLWRLPVGVRLEGEGRVSFCPCLGTPLALRFSEATVAPPHDLVLKDPVLELFGVPLAWLPVVWLRSTGRVGLLPPDLEWRGRDGFFAGGGVHVPWRNGDVSEGVSIRAGGYVEGGVAVETALLTSATSTRIRWDRLRGEDGLSIAARGATVSSDDEPHEVVAWRLSALRGARSVASTTDVGAAAQPFDRGAAQASWSGAGWTFASGVRTVMARGGELSELGAGGPVITARRSEAIADVGAYDMTLEGGQVAGGGFGATSFLRGEAGALVATTAGPLGAHLAVRGAGDLASDSVHQSADGTAQARLSVGLPLARSYPSGEALDPWVHTTEPRIEGAIIASHLGRGLVPAGRGVFFPDGSGWVAAVGWDNTVTRTSSRATADFQAAAGVTGTAQRALPLLRARLNLEGPWAAFDSDFARVLAGDDELGGVLVSKARLGPALGLNVSAHVAERDHLDPQMARSLTDPVLEPGSGFLLSSGWSGGARAGLPLGSRLALRGGADADFLARSLVAAVAAVEVHDPCDCVVVRLTGAHRIGRSGVDVWLSVELPVSR
jgi:hypothetical protein